MKGENEGGSGTCPTRFASFQVLSRGRSPQK